MNYIYRLKTEKEEFFCSSAAKIIQYMPRDIEKDDNVYKLFHNRVRLQEELKSKGKIFVNKKKKVFVEVVKVL
ncbi:hypothetical protein [Olivibacter sitiensis]|uniref:hypothetical protein n=1 Tax=Olivibacter sitiensis TaxID=376470 RepID=UPI0004180BE4|nr:hypothetical protein [Olivibacter sitiensis]